MKPDLTHTSPYRNAQNVLVYSALFLERAKEKNKPAILPNTMYTLKPWDVQKDGKNFISLYLRYLEMEDILEYNFALRYFESWTHWDTLCASSWFKPIITRWRKELNLKIQARSLDLVRREAIDPDSKNAFMAAKYILDKGWEEKESKSQRKTKKDTEDDIKREVQRQRDEEVQVLNDLERIKSG